MTIGYDKPLYVLPFDYCASFANEMFDGQSPPLPVQAGQFTAVNRVIFDAIKLAVAAGVPKHRAGVLVEEQFGADILREAASEGLISAWAAEKSGHEEFEIEDAPHFARHIHALNPTFCKAIARYNSGGEKARNRRQAERLRQLSEILHANRRLFMLDLLVPPEPGQLHRLGGDKKAYEMQLRPTLIIQAIHEIQDAGVEPDVWILEGLDRIEDCRKVVTALRRAGRDKVGCIIQGRHESDAKVRRWLTIAAPVPGFIGFAVGSTTFWDPLVNYLAGKITRDCAATQIAASFLTWVDVFENAKRRAN